MQRQDIGGTERVEEREEGSMVRGLRWHPQNDSDNV